MVETCDAWRLSPSVEFRQMRKHCSAELLLRCDLFSTFSPPAVFVGGGAFEFWKMLRRYALAAVYLPDRMPKRESGVARSPASCAGGG